MAIASQAGFEVGDAFVFLVHRRRQIAQRGELHVIGAGRSHSKLCKWRQSQAKYKYCEPGKAGLEGTSVSENANLR